MKAGCLGASGHAGLVGCLDFTSYSALDGSWRLPCCRGGCWMLVSLLSLLTTNFIGVAWLSGS